MWTWLQKVFGRSQNDAPVAHPVRRDPPALRVVRADEEGVTGFEQLLKLTGQSLPDRQILTPQALVAEEQLSTRVLEHFRKNRPAPSSLPASSLQVLTLVSEPNLSLSELTRTVSQDPALTAAILKVANSPAYAGTSELESIRDAVTRLGLVEVGRVAGMVSARSLFQPQVRSEFTAMGSRWSDTFTDAVAAARGSAWLALQVKGANSDHAFLGGILHDLGRSVALRSVAALSMAEQCFELTGTQIDRVVERVHVEIGSEVHSDWGLPRFPTLVAKCHHERGLPVDGDYVDVHVIRLCSSLVQLRRHPWRVDGVREEVDESCKALRLDGYVLRSLDTQLRHELDVLSGATSASPRKRVAP